MTSQFSFPSQSRPWPPRISLALLLAAGVVVQSIVVWRSVLPAQDSVRYVELAERFAREGLLATLRDEIEHPLYPYLVAQAHRAAVAISQASEPETRGEFWIAAAQAVSVAMLVLSIWPVYWLLLRLYSPTAAACGTVFYLLLPEVSALGPDALSDSTQLFCWAFALYAAVCSCAGLAAPNGRQHQQHAHDSTAGNVPSEALDRGFSLGRDLGWPLAFGLFAGCGLLARPESAVLLPVYGSLHLFWQLSRTSRLPWLPWLARLSAAAVGFLLLGGGYLIATSSWTPALVADRIWGRADTRLNQPPAATAVVPQVTTPGSTAPPVPGQPAPPESPWTWRLPTGERMVFAAKDASTSSRFAGYGSALWELFRESIDALHWSVGCLCLIGWWQARRQSGDRVRQFCRLLCLVYLLATWHHAAAMGYLSARHLLPVVIIGLGHAGQAAIALSRYRLEVRPPVNSAHGSAAAHLAEPTSWMQAASRQMWAGVPLCVALVACSWETFQPQHESRWSHRQAADWLAEHSLADQQVLDSRGWTGLYSGRTTYAMQDARAVLRDLKLAYIVVEQQELQRDSTRSRTMRHLLSGAAEPVAAFAGLPHRQADLVVIYRWHAERFTRRLRRAQAPPPPATASVSRSTRLPQP